MVAGREINPIAEAIVRCFESTNVCGSNLEPANIVDAIAHAGDAIQRLGGSERSISKLADSISNLADAIRVASEVVDDIWAPITKQIISRLKQEGSHDAGEEFQGD